MEITEEEYQQLTAARDSLAASTAKLEELSTTAEERSARIANLESTLQTRHTELVNERTAKQLLESQQGAAAARIAELEAKASLYDTTKAERDQLHAKIAQIRKQSLLQAGLSEEDVANLTESELEAAEKILPKIKVTSGSGVRYDTGGTGGTDRNSLSGFGMIRDGIENEWEKFSKRQP